MLIIFTFIPLLFPPKSGLTALEVWCLAMIAIVFLTLFSYAVILVHLIVVAHKRDWRVELVMFLFVLNVTFVFLLTYVSVI